MSKLAKLDRSIFDAASATEASITVGEDNFYDNLPKGITRDTVETVRDYEAKYASSAGTAMAVAAKEYLKENPDCDTFTGEFSMGKGVTLHHSFHRNEESKEWTSVSSIDRDIGDLVGELKQNALSQFKE